MCRAGCSHNRGVSERWAPNTSRYPVSGRLFLQTSSSGSVEVSQAVGNEQWAVSTVMTFAMTFARKNAFWKAKVPPRRAGHPGIFPGGEPSLKVPSLKVGFSPLFHPSFLPPPTPGPRPEIGRPFLGEWGVVQTSIAIFTTSAQRTWLISVRAADPHRTK